MKRLTDIYVFNRSSDSEWAAPTLIQTKKTGDVRILTDSRRLNEQIKRKQFPLPRISDILRKLSGLKYTTAVDLIMAYYQIPLYLEAQKLFTKILPWGKYQYKRLPMGVNTSPDIFQRIMYELLGDIPNIQVYLDDIRITSNGTFEEHAAIMEQVLERLQKANLRANLLKCFFGEAKIDYLGYEITRDGIKPQPKKVEARLKLSPPETKGQVRHFLGMINYYRDIWQKRSHMLAPLTGLVSPLVKYKWGEEQPKVFDEIKQKVSQETLLASNKQLGAVIMQEEKPLAFYSRKLNSAQTRYTTGEQELLSIVETLKEFRDILLYQQFIVHTDHLNILLG
jgi:hypothetical protein